MLRRDVVRRALVGRASHRSFLRRAVVSTAAVFLATAAGAATAPQLGPRQVGEEVALTTSNPAVRVAGGRDAAPVLVWSEVLQFPGATYIAPHFSRFSLPPGAHLVVRDPMGKRQWTYAGKGKPENYPSGGWGPEGSNKMLARDGRTWRRP